MGGKGHLGKKNCIFSASQKFHCVKIIMFLRNETIFLPKTPLGIEKKAIFANVWQFLLLVFP